MTDTFNPDNPTSMMEYLSDPVESSSDADAAEDLQPPTEPIHDDQSSDDGDGVATETDPEQAEDDGETDVDSGEADSSDAASPDAATVDWDSEANPHLKAAQQLEAIRQFAEQQKAEADAKEAREALIKAGTRITEVDESDLPVLMGDFIDEVSEQAVRPVLAQVQQLEHGFASVVAAIKTLPVDTQKLIQEKSAEYRALGESAEDIEKAFTVSQRERDAATEREATLKKQIKNLTAQLAAQAIKNNGEDRTESSSVGGTVREPATMLEYLSDGPL